MKKFIQTKTLLAVLLGLGLGATALPASATEFQLGGHVGAIGATGTGSDSAIGYGVHFLVNPFSIAAFRVDATFASLGGGTYFSSSPALEFYIVNFSEFRVGILGGAGFYRFPGIGTKFGLNIGAEGTFSLSENFYVGMETRYHPVFGTGASNMWNVFLTAGFRFEPGSGW